MLGRLAERRSALERYGEMDASAYLGDEEIVAASKYRLITAMEDVLDRGLADRLQSMARVRNLLVHVYGDVDDRRVHRFLREDLDDFDDFIATVLEAFPELEPDDG